MTGFGRAAADSGRVRLSVEVRSVNHRGLDIKVRSAEPDGFCDGEISRTVRGAVERVAVSVVVREERIGDGAAALDLPQVRELHAALERIRREAGLVAPVDLGTVAAFLAAGRPAGLPLRGEALWEALSPVLAAALGELAATRAREGA